MSRDETAYGGARTVTIAFDLPVTPALARLWIVSPTVHGLAAWLPDARDLGTGGPLAAIVNAATDYGLNIRDHEGGLLHVLPGGGRVQLWLADNTTAAGTWLVW